MKKVTGFIVRTAGDKSVGIFPSKWEITGEFFFDDQDSLEEFRKDIAQCFGNHAGEYATALTFEEAKASFEAEEKFLAQVAKEAENG